MQILSQKIEVMEKKGNGIVRETIASKLLAQKQQLKLDYHHRLTCVKEILPYNWRTQIIEREEIYNNKIGLTLLHNVYNALTEDFRILGIMEKISKENAKN